MEQWLYWKSEQFFFLSLNSLVKQMSPNKNLFRFSRLIQTLLSLEILNVVGILSHEGVSLQPTGPRKSHYLKERKRNHLVTFVYLQARWIKAIDLLKNKGI